MKEITEVPTHPGENSSPKSYKEEEPEKKLFTITTAVVKTLTKQDEKAILYKFLQSLFVCLSVTFLLPR